MASEQLGSLRIPSPGYGTLRIGDGNVAKNVRRAIETGYRTIDAAQYYGNQPAVGEGIASSSVSRDELFIESKVLHPGLRESVDVEQTIEDAYECLEDLGVDYLDVLYVHWRHTYDLERVFEAFDRLYDEGVFEHLGLSNFLPEHLEEASEVAGQPIAATQAEVHPLLHQEELRAYCAGQDIALVAYCPVIRGTADQVPELQEIAQKHDVSPYQVSLAWVSSTGAVPVPMCVDDQIRENWESQHLELDEEDVQLIDAIEREERQVDPDYAPW